MKTPATYRLLIHLIGNLSEHQQNRLLRMIISPRDLRKTIYTFRDEICTGKSPDMFPAQTYQALYKAEKASRCPVN